MSRVLLSGFRWRAADENFNPPGNEFPFRLVFTDSSTTSPKEVYSGPDLGDTSLGSIVNLDALGYVPVTGIWLDIGRYTIELERKISDLPEVWDSVFVMPKVEGGTDESVIADTVIRFVDTVAEIRALIEADWGGVVLNTGYYSLNDGGQGQWRWVSTSIKADDGGTTIKPTGKSIAEPGRFERYFSASGEVSAALWGVISGQADVSGNMELAQNWCGRTADDTGNTLGFPTGEYKIGGPVLLNAVGQTLGALDKPVQYHIYEGCRFFSDTAGVGIQIINRAIIDSTTTVSENLKLAEVAGGEVDPRWWGADNTAAVNAADAWVNMYTQVGLNPAIGPNAIALKGDYWIDGGECITDYLDGARITYKVYPDSSMYIGPLTTRIDIGEIIDYSGGARNTGKHVPIFTGNYQRIQFFGNVFWAHWVNPIEVFGLELMQTMFTQVSSVAGGGVVVKWDYRFIFDFDYDANIYGGANTVHDFSNPQADWSINDYDVIINNAIIPDRRVFYFASASSVGTIDITEFKTIKAVWFGALGASIANDMNHLMRIVEIYSKDVDFGGYKSTTAGLIELNLSSGADVVFNNFYLSHVGVLVTGVFSVSGGTDTKFRMNGGKISATNTGNILLNSAVGQLVLKGCDFDNGFVNIANSISLSMTGGSFEDCIINLTSANEPNKLQMIKNNEMINTQMWLYTNAGFLLYTRIIENDWVTDELIEGEAFINIVSLQALSVIAHCVVMRNTYRQNQAGVSLVYNVLDMSQVSTPWLNYTLPGNEYDQNGTNHSLVIKDENLDIVNMNGRYPIDYARMEILVTEGWARIEHTYGIGAPYVRSELKNMDGYAFRLKGVLSSRSAIISGIAETEAVNATPAFALKPWFYGFQTYRNDVATAPDGQCWITLYAPEQPVNPTPDPDLTGLVYFIMNL